jgi:hypothetical protein
MKPCSRNRKLIAWLALDALDGRRASALRDHLDHCEGCRHYWEAVSSVTEKLAAAEAGSDFEASEVFHRRVAEKVQAAESSSAVGVLVARLRGLPLSWRVALPAAAALVIVLLVMVAPRHRPIVSPPAPAVVQIGSPSNPGNDLVPTVANYQMVASQSLEQLDELLIRQGNKPLPPAPVYTPSGLALANAPF